MNPYQPMPPPYRQHQGPPPQPPVGLMPPPNAPAWSHAATQPYPAPNSFQSQYGSPYQSRPPKACFICRDPNHLTNTCPHKTPRPQHDYNTRPAPPPSAQAPPTDPSHMVNITMDSAEEADEVCASAEVVRKRKHPINATDFKALATELVTQLRQTATHMPNEHVCHATSSPNKSVRSAAAVPKVRRRSAHVDRPPSPPMSIRSRGGSINSSSAFPRMKSIFEKQAKVLSVAALKKQLDDVDIEWNTNDFRTLKGKAAKITELAIFQATVAIADLKADSL